MRQFIGICGCVLLVALASPAWAQQSRCADCHFANLGVPSTGGLASDDRMAVSHITDWDLSAHSREGVGCEKCHGGDASTFERVPAHREVLHSSNPASPVHRQNLPATCGACHLGQVQAFQKSHHFELLTQGDTRGPVCTTCHSGAGVRTPSPKALESECGRCHGPGGVAARPGRASEARTLYEAVNDARDILKSARRLIDRVNDTAQQQRLEDGYRQAEVALTLAVQAGHAFVYDNLKELVYDARQRTEAVLGQLANPK
jgi:hypothetical protein